MAVKSAHLVLRRPRAFAGVAIAAVAVVGAACTGSSGGSPSSAQSAAPGSATSAPSAASGTSSASAASTARSGPSSVPDPDGTTGRGNIDQTVAPVTAATLPAVALTRPVTVGTTARVSLRSVRAIQASAQGPGEIAGPALAVTVRIVNASSRSLDVGAALVRVQDAKGQVATPTTASPAAPLRGRLAPGASAQGVYVVTVATSDRDPISVYVSYAAGVPVAHFRGNAA